MNIRKNTSLKILALLTIGMLNTFGGCKGGNKEDIWVFLSCIFNPTLPWCISRRPAQVSCPRGCGPGYCSTIYYCGTNGCYTRGEWKYDPHSTTCGKSLLTANGSSCFNCGRTALGNDVAYFKSNMQSQSLSSQMLLPGGSVLGLRESIKIQFGKSMDPVPPDFGGSLASQNQLDFRWQKTTKENDTLLIFPVSAWTENASGASLSVKANTLARENITFSTSFSRIGYPPPPPPPPAAGPQPPPCDILCQLALCYYSGICG